MTLGELWILNFGLQMNERRQLSQIIGIYLRFIHQKNSPKIIRVY
ncbi:hypothetical protein [Nodularia sp. UHCC 0506]|nr:hypothetical protein [Nodularia sp. UHCC 0506]MEA5515303.1 hypothetical protein [Nodularia sp. UHCC 0506]